MGTSTRTADILLLRRPHADGLHAIDQAAGGKLGPASGLLLGVVLGAGLWLALGLLAWSMFR